MPDATDAPLEIELTALPGVGPGRASQLERLGLRTIGDLLLHRPRRYEDRHRLVSLANLEKGSPAHVTGEIVAAGVKRFARGRKSVFEFILDTGAGRLHCRWWNAPYLESKFHTGDQMAVYGKVVSLRPPTIDHPDTETIVSDGEGKEEASIHLNRIVPIYPLTEGLPQRWLRVLIWQALNRLGDKVTEPHPEIVIDDFPTRENAIRMLHFPEEMEDADVARQRLALDEFIELQLNIQGRRRKLESKARPIPCAGDNRLIKPFVDALGFGLTEAQNTALRELRADMAGGAPMRRLLQGDVGSGKTVVAAVAALMAIESGHDVALMAPTEILAEQHFVNFTRWLGPLGVSVHLRTGARKTATEQDQAALHLGSDAATPDLPTLTVGTHALIEEGFNAANLGLVIIDEQHKFGVNQREKLLRKGDYPHLLVMTATPIPRTLGLTLYGDLDISTIDQLPPGRGTVRTFARTPDRLPKVWQFIRDKLTEGRQAYIVYPRVEETDNSSLKAVTRELGKIRKQLEPHQVGLLHGRLKPEEKEAVMTDFRENRIQALLATTVVEVGVDVPNATVMLIENAEQFGLAQLHQLRGRIGRGGEESFCILVGECQTEAAKQRMQIMVETNDGFRIAEFDLSQRGPGELTGKDQSGEAPFRFGDLRTDARLVLKARELVKEHLRRGR